MIIVIIHPEKYRVCANGYMVAVDSVPVYAETYRRPLGGHRDDGQQAGLAFVQSPA
ncbi:hypothetical protein [Methylobacterium pseudosasicola]|uniref:hypothetical protein n=1 Tax=Methylobacterium pseudosasicola TaxID=582667 RepID=UPI001428990A|nr:hypothetical protein [Methylobacterium pseudosasicola]